MESYEENVIQIYIKNLVYQCDDLQQRKIKPEAESHIRLFLGELNGTRPNFFVRNPYFIFFLFLLFTIAIIVTSLISRVLFYTIPIAILIVCMLTSLIVVYLDKRGIAKLIKVIERYRIMLKPYYTVVNQLVLIEYPKTSLYDPKDHYNSRAVIKLIPVEMFKDLESIPPYGKLTAQHAYEYRRQLSSEISNKRILKIQNVFLYTKLIQTFNLID